MRYLALLLLLGACYNPDLTGPNAPRYLCDESMRCPDGLTCSAGQCLSEAELASFDLAQPPTPLDGGPPPTAAPPCRSGQGFVLDGAARQRAACPGKFAAMMAPTLCAAGFGICTTLSDPEKLACDTINSGFFTSTVRGARPGPGQPSCQSTNNRTYLVGCGGRQPGTATVNNCKPFDKGLDCYAQGTVGWSWQCNGSDGILQAGYSGTPGSGAAVDGVLCCKM